jgi:hypothetical protein
MRNYEKSTRPGDYVCWDSCGNPYRMKRVVGWARNGGWEACRLHAIEGQPMNYVRAGKLRELANLISKL